MSDVNQIYPKANPSQVIDAPASVTGTGFTALFICPAGGEDAGYQRPIASPDESNGEREPDPDLSRQEPELELLAKCKIAEEVDDPDIGEAVEDRADRERSQDIRESCRSEEITRRPGKNEYHRLSRNAAQQILQRSIEAFTLLGVKDTVVREKAPAPNVYNTAFTVRAQRDQAEIQGKQQTHQRQRADHAEPARGHPPADHPAGTPPPSTWPKIEATRPSTTRGPESFKLPQQLLDVLAKLPAYIDRRIAAAAITQYFFPISHRTLEVWSVPIQHVNGKAIGLAEKYFEEAYRRLKAAPIIMGGRRTQLRRLDVERADGAQIAVSIGRGHVGAEPGEPPCKRLVECFHDADMLAPDRLAAAPAQINAAAQQDDRARARDALGITMRQDHAGDLIGRGTGEGGDPADVRIDPMRARRRSRGMKKQET